MFDFYTKFFSQLDSGLSTYWQSVAASVSSELMPVAYTLLAIYTALWGYTTWKGKIHEPFVDGVSRIVKMAIVVGIALNMGNYNAVLADMLWNSPDALAELVASGSADTSSNAAFLDSLMGQFYALAEAYNAKAYADTGLGIIPDFTLLLMGYLVWLFGIVLTGYAAFFLALSKMALAVLLGIGPIFVLMTLFDSTKRYFDSWLGQCMNYVFMVMLVGAVIKLVISILVLYIAAPDMAMLMKDPTVNLAFPTLVFSLMSILIMCQIPSIASTLGGGMALSTLGAVGAAFAMTRRGLGMARPTSIRRGINNVRADYRIAKNAARSVGRGAGRLYNKVTGRRRPTDPGQIMTPDMIPNKGAQARLPNP